MRNPRELSPSRRSDSGNALSPRICLSALWVVPNIRLNMPTAPVIETQALTKVFGPQRALDGVNLTVALGGDRAAGPQRRRQEHLHEVPAPASTHHFRLRQTGRARGRTRRPRDTKTRWLYSRTELPHPRHGRLRVCHLPSP